MTSKDYLLSVNERSNDNEYSNGCGATGDIEPMVLSNDVIQKWFGETVAGED